MFGDRRELIQKLNANLSIPASRNTPLSEAENELQGQFNVALATFTELASDRRVDPSIRVQAANVLYRMRRPR